MQSTSLAQAEHMWSVRERCAEALKLDGYTYKQDISLPLKHYYDVCHALRERVDGRATRVVLYGHLGDGNAHLNVTSPDFDPVIQER